MCECTSAAILSEVKRSGTKKDPENHVQCVACEVLRCTQDDARLCDSMTGHLHLVCGVDSSGRSFLREQSFRAPMHISKPFFDEQTLVVNVVNPTAGLFAGDDVSSTVKIESGARMLLTSPSASRVHRMQHAGDVARFRQEFSIAHSAFLEVLPEIFIPQNGARYDQRTRIAVEPGGELLFFETLAPGRVASGEVFAFARLDWETDIFHGGEKIARERYSLSPADDSLHALRAPFSSAAYYASCFAIGERFLSAKNDCWDKLYALHSNDVWIGCSRLAGGGFVIKLLAANSIVLREKLRALRATLYAAQNRSPPALRRF